MSFPLCLPFALSVLLLVVQPTVFAESAAAQPAAQPAALRAGPMPSGVAPTRAVLWVQTTAAARLFVEYRTVPADSQRHWQRSAYGIPAGEWQRSAEVATAGPDFSASLPLAGLRPATRYAYRLLLDGRAVPTGIGSFCTAPPDSAGGADLTLALGSCAFVADPYPAEGYGIFRRILDQQPDVMLWLGDNVYLWGDEWASAAAAARRYAHTRALPDLQPLLRGANHAAIWDDHDFGPNDADSTLPTRRTMLDVFRRFWPHDLYEAAPGGATGHFRWGDVEFWLLDDRSWRTPKRGTPRRLRSQLGARQRAWLLAGLRASTAGFKLVAVGGQVLSSSGRGETFCNGFRRERRALLRALDSSQVKNVVFLTGDRHYAELSRRESRRGATLIELTASPLTSSPARPKANRQRVAGTVVDSHNFATVTMSHPNGTPQLTLRLFDAAGGQRWQFVVNRTDD